MPPVRAQARTQDAAVLAHAVCALGLEHDSAGAISEKHAGGAILPVDNAREGLRADHQRALECAGLEQAINGGEPKNKTRAHGLQIKRSTVCDSETGLH